MSNFSITNNAAINILVQVFGEMLSVTCKNQLLGHGNVNVRTTKLFSNRVAQFCILTSSTHRF